MSNSKNMLVLGAVWPEPRSSAAGAHLLQVLAPFLKTGWKIDFASTAADATHATNLPEIGISPHTIRVNDPAFDTLLDSLQPDIVLFDRFFIEEQFGWRVEEICPAATRILNTEDLHSLRESRQRANTSSPEPPPETVRPADSRVARREIASIFRSDLSLIISEAEIEYLHREFGIPPDLMHYAPFMLAPPTLETQAFWPAYHERRDFICIGNFRHAPNWDAIRWMAKDIWPRIRQQLPEARLLIAGAYPTDTQLALSNPEQGLIVEGRIEDAGAAFRQARVCLAPLRFGAGLKGKLFDAMASGTPSVTTTLGAEGICGELPFGGLIADDAERIADAAVQLYAEEAAWRDAQRKGIQILTERFDRRAHETALLAAVEKLCTELTSRRQDNFTGAMLRDHFHKSTRYLSLWIEAKNKLAEQSAPASPSIDEVENIASSGTAHRSELPSRKNLMNSKWSAVHPRNKEKHFLLTRLIESKNTAQKDPRVELEALLSKRRFEIELTELADKTRWRKGWI
ncbi:MAG: TIGR02450 family Trp-rich protein [Myxococcota bacterium]